MLFFEEKALSYTCRAPWHQGASPRSLLIQLLASNLLLSEKTSMYRHESTEEEAHRPCGRAGLGLCGAGCITATCRSECCLELAGLLTDAGGHLMNQGLWLEGGLLAGITMVLAGHSLSEWELFGDPGELWAHGSHKEWCLALNSDHQPDQGRKPHLCWTPT